ncbi:fungal-specific transcription factor domain-containing protein [Cyathus striatus]|nr:fungal-specific transcription factor domain-containing protein [Cyathus striatus]
MSSDDEENSVLQGLKKRRIQRACDICRRKKIRCDGVQMPGNRCSNCIAYNFECTYVEAAKKRGPPKGYVESLENRLVKLEKLLRRICPDESFLKDLDTNLDTLISLPSLPAPIQPSSLTASIPSSLPGPTPPRNPTEIATSVIRRAGTVPPADQVEDVDEQQLILSENLKRLVIDPGNYRFFGKSSGAMLIQTALELKKEYEVSGAGEGRSVLGERREEFWNSRPWEQEQPNEPASTPYTFPPSDLIHMLVDLYFAHMNLFFPLLHRPTFLALVQAQTHLTDDAFGGVVLLVCAVGSKFCEDERTKLDGEESMHSAGWKYFNQVQMVKKSLLRPPGLWDLQKQCLLVQFLQSSSAPQSCWTMVGIGIRVAQDVGAHRRKPPRPINTSTSTSTSSNSYPSSSHQSSPHGGGQPRRDASSQGGAPDHSTGGPGGEMGEGGEGVEYEWTVEDELWKRAFWCLVCMDRSASAALGRPCAIQDEDFDVDYPLEVDDEYWDHPDPAMRFKQPPGKPSSVTFFNLFLRLHQVLAFTLRTIYSINKSKILLGFVGQQWEQHIVAELDSALNKWVDSVPDHLRWDPSRENLQHFNQSVLLYCSYYHIQILIHRPFIPSPSKPSPLSFPSLAICTNAARSCSHVVDMCRRRNGVLVMPQLQMPAFTAGIVLLLSIWGGKRSGLTTDPKKEMADVHKCMQVLRCIERSWHSAGRLWDILYELASVGDLPLPHPSPPGTNKRARDAESPKDASTPGSVASTSASLSSAIEPCFERTIAGSRRVQKEDGGSRKRQERSQSQSHSRRVSLPMDDIPSHHSPPHQQQNEHQRYGLPMYSDELARFPVHSQPRFAGSSSSVDTAGEMWFNPPAMHVPEYQNNIPSLTQGFAGARPGMQNVDMMYESGSVGMGGYLNAAPYAMEPVYRGNGMEGVHPLPHQQQNQMHPQQLQQQQQMRYPMQQQQAFDSDTVAMWSNAPTGFELDEWGTYLSSVSELTQHPPGPGHMYP